MRRRTFIKAASVAASLAAVGAVTGGAGIGLRVARKYTINTNLRKKGYAKSEAELKELERLAIETQNGKRIVTSSSVSDTLADYEFSFMYSLGPNFSYGRSLSKIKDIYPFDKHLIVSDIGGSYGTAAECMNKMDNIEAFVIDPNNELPPEGNGLPRNRFFVKRIEDTGLPDETFHFMTSTNTYQWTDVPVSFTEPYRLLKRRGCALLQVQQWAEADFLDKIDALDIKENILVALDWPDKPQPFDVFYAGPKAIFEKYGKIEGANMLLSMYQPSFIINKP